ncbi:MAG TPA: hypothetical protein VGU65_02230 [Frateuria sp.]|uniref:hypothetical protein n=1 Tax=Frateuria sp. TaxID=2211372 RepID=UPI002DEB5302|nr:hypothetical protein [Frateuria sp.]
MAKLLDRYARHRAADHGDGDFRAAGRPVANTGKGRGGAHRDAAAGMGGLLRGGAAVGVAGISLLVALGAGPWSRRTVFIAAALLVLVGARMPAWRDAAIADAATMHAPSLGGGAQEWSGARAAWQWAPALRRRLGLVLTWEGS